MDKLLTLIKERPMFHLGETEIKRSFTKEESFLSEREIQKLESKQLTCYGLEAEVLTYLSKNITKNSKSLETGAGCSTLIFAYCGSHHTTITPSKSEIELIKKYAAKNEINLDKVIFVPQPSDQYLPGMEDSEFDMILLDGKHAFPWPIIDWFYTADKLKMGGLMIIDDAEMKSVSILIDFMKADPGWELVKNFSGKTIMFKKTRELIHDVAWHMQPYTAVGTIKKVTSRIKHFVNR